MILITGAAGKTGKALVKALSHYKNRLRVLVRTQEQQKEGGEAGGVEAVIGDLRDTSSLVKALKGVQQIYYICPNIAPDELEIGKNLIQLACENGVEHFVYHSVLHPQVEAMPHHWQKMRMEELLFVSGLDFTILQPCAYMQNILAGWENIIQKGIYSVPYAASARLSLVDLADVGEAAAVVLTHTDHKNAVYELAGPEALSQNEVARILGEKLNRSVQVEVLDRKQWSINARKQGMTDYQIQILLKMFEYYENNGLVGNPKVLTMLLKRPPNDLAKFIQHHAQTHMNHSEIINKNEYKKESTQ